FVKANTQTAGEGNLYLKLTDSESVKAKLEKFREQFAKIPQMLFSIETASRLGESLEKKHVTTYRAVCMIMKKNNKYAFRANTLWRTVSNDSNLSSHTHTKTEYLTENKVARDGVITDETLATAKLTKHATLEKSKPALFHALKYYCLSSTSLNFEKSIAAT